MERNTYTRPMMVRFLGSITEEEPDQWKRFAEIVVERKPKKIGINQSDYWGLADGIVATELQLLNDSLPSKYRKRITSAERLAVAWLKTRTALEMQIYPQICRIAREIIAEGFSNRVIQPGDLLHVDFGIKHLRLNTDTQQHAYVLMPGEKEAYPAQANTHCT
jgi:hypothetical protein